MKFLKKPKKICISAKRVKPMEITKLKISSVTYRKKISGLGLTKRLIIYKKA